MNNPPDRQLPAMVSSKMRIPSSLQPTPNEPFLSTAHRKPIGFYAGLQIGLASAAGISIAGLFTTISLIPTAKLVMTLVATLYLLYLAYSIASSPVGQKTENISTSASPFAGLLLGITNPKAYLAFISLFGSFQIISSSNSLAWLSGLSL